MAGLMRETSASVPRQAPARSGQGETRQTSHAQRHGRQSQQWLVHRLIGVARNDRHRVVPHACECLDEGTDRGDHTIAARQIGVGEMDDPHSRHGPSPAANPWFPRHDRPVKSGCQFGVGSLGKINDCQRE
jgi:hypothetical protein